MSVKISLNGKYFYLILFLIALSAFLIRLKVSSELYAHHSLSCNPPSTLDMGVFIAKSEAIFDGTYKGPLRFLPIYYAVFLPLVYFFLGKGIWGVLTVQSLLGGLSVWLTGLCGAMVRNRKTGLLAAVLLTFALMPILHTAYILIATLQTFLLILTVFIFLLAFKRNTLYLWSILGLLCSILFLTRGNTLLLLPVIIYFMISRRLHGDNKATDQPSLSTGVSKTLALFIISFILPILGMTIYGTIMASGLTPPTSGGINVLSYGWNPETPAGGVTYSQTVLYWSQHSAETPILMQMLSWLLREPLVVMELFLRKCMLFWDSAEITNNITNFDVCRTASYSLRTFHFLPTSFFLFGFLSSAIVLWKRLRKKQTLLLLFSMVAVYFFSIVIFLNLTRYRLPLIPLLAIFTAIFFDMLVNKKNGIRKRPALFLTATGIGLFITFLLFPLYRFHIEKYIHRLIHPNGVIIPLGKTVIYEDNGPILFGSHTRFPYLPGMKLTKYFNFRKEDIGKDASLQIPVIAEPGMKLVMKVNGRTFMIFPKPQGTTIGNGRFSNTSLSNSILSFPVKVNAKGEYDIEMISPLKQNTLFFIDTQRSYGRTFINGQKIDGEAVCRVVVRNTE